MWFEEFQDGHLGYRNGTISAIFNFHVATMPPTKFQLNPTYGSGGDVENVKINDGQTKTRTLGHGISLPGTGELKK